MNLIAPDWLLNFYSNHGEGIAAFIKNKPIFKAILRPLFEGFAWIGKKERGF